MPAKYASQSILFVFYPKRSYAVKQTSLCGRISED